ncbi:MAG: thrombospondin type 3 repeat-containing protein, partial [Endomicrobia bacterium]|nr:thrombospondin type 3 repeat-containing protein [Endomicrobiia bacterium]
MNKKLKKIFTFVITTHLLLLCIGYNFVINVYDMVGKSSTTFVHTTVPLPSVTKATSDWIPLWKIDISTNISAPFELKSITVTLIGVSNFEILKDISEIRILKDDKNGQLITTSTTTWNGASIEQVVNVSPIITSSGTPGPFWRLYFSFTNEIPIDAPNRWFTIYFCVKTSSQIPNTAQFRVRNTLGDITLNISNNIFTPTLPVAVSTMTADTIPPQFVASYTLNPTNGTSLTVFNFDTFNIYTTTTDAGNNVFADNSIQVKIKLTESDVSLSNNNIVPLADLIVLDTAEIDANNPVNFKSISYLGSNEFGITYTLIQTTINSPTIALPLKIKVRDAAGNETEWDNSFRCFIDRAKPTPPSITSPDDGVWINTTYPQLSWQPSIEDNIWGYYILFSTCSIVEDWWYNTQRGNRAVGNILYSDWGSNLYWSGNYPVSSTQEYYWAVAARDKAGNISVSQPKNFKFDSENPVIYSRTPPHNFLFSYSTPTITVNVGDTLAGETLSGIDFKRTKLYVNNTEVLFSTETVDSATTTLKFTASLLQDGLNNVKIDLFDKVGNFITSSWSFYIDTTKPESKDTDNDGYSDQDELLSGTNPSDQFSFPAKPRGFWPLDGMVLKSDYFSGGATVTLRLDDIVVNNFSSGLDVIFTTSSLTDKIFIQHITKGTIENWVYLPTRSWVGSSSATICIQLLRAFATNGSDDGEIQLKYKVKDNAGNTTGWILRKFYYDTTPPIISTVSAPSQVGSETPVNFIVSINDNVGVSEKSDDIQFGVWIDNVKYTYSMIPQANNQWRLTQTFSGITGVVN